MVASKIRDPAPPADKKIISFRQAATMFNDEAANSNMRRRPLLVSRNENVGMGGRRSCTAEVFYVNLLLQWAFLSSVYSIFYATTVHAQDICGCSPRTFTLNLDFSLACPPTNITSGGGIAAVSCLVSPFGAPATDLTPVVVESISILELDQSNNVIVEERIEGNLLDGDTFSYTSVLDNTGSITISEQIPRALQMNLNGRNLEGVILLNVFIITYSNECGFVPVIQDGHSAGWVIFVSASEDCRDVW